MRINCIIVEDEPLALERARDFVLKVPYLHLLHTFDNAMDALVYLKTNSVDVMFLDIHLGEFSGIQLLESSAISSQVILTTAYHEYALKGFDLKVTDYLLKPYTFERFLQAVDRVVQAETKQEPAKGKNFIFVKTEHRLEKILLEELLYIEGMRDYRRIHTVHKRIMTLQTFADLEQDIPSGLVCRVHKSYMVALNKIETIEKDRIKIGNTLIPISETYKQPFFELIKR